MSKKARQIAWELIRVLSKYRESEVSQALLLLKTGDLFKEIPDYRSFEVDQNTLESRKLSDKISILQDAFPDLEQDIRSQRAPDEEGILNLLHGIRSGEILPTGRHIRYFSETIGVELPKKSPTRAVLARKLIERLMQLSINERTKFIADAIKSSGKESSLKDWSDLIVKS